MRAAFGRPVRLWGCRPGNHSNALRLLAGGLIREETSRGLRDLTRSARKEQAEQTPFRTAIGIPHLLAGILGLPLFVFLGWRDRSRRSARRRAGSDGTSIRAPKLALPQWCQPPWPARRPPPTRRVRTATTTRHRRATDRTEPPAGSRRHHHRWQQRQQSQWSSPNTPIDKSAPNDKP